MSKLQTEDSEKKFIPVHRTNFGIKQVYLEKSLDSLCENRYCADSFKWIFNGIHNLGLEGSSYDRFFDVLNANEFLAFYVGVWKLKYQRDEGKGYAYSTKLTEGIANNLYFPQLIERCIEAGLINLSKHWDKGVFSNSDPYAHMNPPLKTRLSELEQAVESDIRRSLAYKVRLPMHEDPHGVINGDFRQPLKLYRTKDENGRWQWHSMGVIDKRAYAEAIYHFFKSKEELWFPWHEDIQFAKATHNKTTGTDEGYCPE